MRPAGVGHGNIPPSPQRNTGVVISDAERIAFLSFAGLNRLRFPVGVNSSLQRNTAARTVLACLALYADRLAFNRPSLLLRSGCELIVTSEVFQWVKSRGETEGFALSTNDAQSALNIALDRARSAGLAWNGSPLELAPKPNLVALLTATFTKYTELDSSEP